MGNQNPERALGTVKEEQKTMNRFSKRDFHILKEISDDSNFLQFLERFAKLKAQCIADGQKVKSMEQEDDFGNIEYKLKLVNPTFDRVEHLTTQMKFRLEVKLFFYLTFNNLLGG